jgi:Protein of unknown function (DUF1553)/Protein of unknown function (DUF1549)/Bacterial Ig-like domain (group 2)
MKTGPIGNGLQVVISILAFAVSGVAGEARALEKLPPGATVAQLEAHPSQLTLKHPFSYAQLLVTARLATGERIDATRMVTYEKNSDAVSISATGFVRPSSDGQARIRCGLSGKSLEIPVTVTGQKSPYTASFVRDIMPVLSKVGCNAGTCHGAQQGKNGFKLSLRGYDPLLDHRALTDDLAGRRFNRAAPDQSLMLLKPSGGVPHVGGALFRPGQPYYELLRTWIAEGVQLDLNSPRVTSLSVFPKAPELPLPAMKQQMVVWATYSDGSVRDVTAEAFVESSNAEVATVDKQGLVTAVRRGEAAMLARYEGAYAAATLIVMGDRSKFAWKDAPANNYIDTLVYEKLKQVKIVPSDLCTDAEFIRRVYLDLTGLPPQPEQVRAFLADSRATKVKRDELIDKLVGGTEFIQHWTNKWADLLQVNRKFLGEQGAAALRSWIQQAIADNAPYDRFAHTILTASGSTLENPPAAYYKVLHEPAMAMENTTHLFLGVRFNCNKCHDHPFERWTQDQYYQLAAYFAQVDRRPDPRYAGKRVGGTDVDGARPLVEIISDGTVGEVRHERTGAIAAPKFPFRHQDLAPATAPRREQIAHWVTSKDNPYFAKSYVNRLWSYLLGVGIIEPVDDIRAGNPPSNPKLLDRLTDEFVASGFNTRQMFRTICKSRTYQLSINVNPMNQDDEVNYSHAVARRLPAEVLYDAIHQVTGAATHLPGLPAGARAAQLLDSAVEVPSGFLAIFGKPPRESACECERSGAMMLGPVLNLVNGPIVGEALKQPANRIDRLTATEKDDARIVQELYLSILCRLPTHKEIETGLTALRAGVPEHQKLMAEHAKLEQAVREYERILPVRQAVWEKSFKNEPVWSSLEGQSATSRAGATLTSQLDGSILAGGKNESPDVYTVKTTTNLTGITGVRLEVLPDVSLPGHGPGRAPNGNFVLNQFRLSAKAKNESGKGQRMLFHRAVADFSQEDYPVTSALDGDAQNGWGIAPAFGKRHVAVFELKEPLKPAAGGMNLTFQLDQRFPSRDHNIGRFRVSLTTSKPPLVAGALPDAIAQILSVPRDKRSQLQKDELARYFRQQDPELGLRRQHLADFPKPGDCRLPGAEDLAWALINSPEFLFNH